MGMNDNRLQIALLEIRRRAEADAEDLATLEFASETETAPTSGPFCFTGLE